MFTSVTSSLRTDTPTAAEPSVASARSVALFLCASTGHLGAAACCPLQVLTSAAGAGGHVSLALVSSPPPCCPPLLRELSPSTREVVTGQRREPAALLLTIFWLRLRRVSLFRPSSLLCELLPVFM